MQDSSTFPPLKAPQPPFPEQEQLKCPRCDSSNTKFCYYNNYNLSQPRHFCKNCRRYWTKGGALRNIPVGGGSRKHPKRSSNPKPPHRSSSSSSSKNPPPPPLKSDLSPSLSPSPAAEIRVPAMSAAAVEEERRMLEVSGSFSSLLASSGQFGGVLVDGFFPAAGGSVGFGENVEAGSGRVGDPGLELQRVEGNGNGNGNGESFLGFQLGDSGGCWTGGGGSGNGGGGNGWPDLAIYTPGSTYE